MIGLVVCISEKAIFQKTVILERLFYMLQVMVGEDMLLRFGGVPLGEACTVVIRGATQQILDEAERSLHDALCVLAATVRESRIVFGGGRFTSIVSLPTCSECKDNVLSHERYAP